MKKLFRLPRAFARRRFHPLTWKRRWKIFVLDLLGREESPERIAAAIAVGIGVGLSPFIGFHIWIALGLAFLLRLNKIDTVLGQFAGNPWTLPAVYAFGYRLGRWILDYDRRSVPGLAWDRLLPFLVGTTVIAIVVGFASYLIFLGILRLYHRRHPRVALRAALRRTTDKMRLQPAETTSASEKIED